MDILVFDYKTQKNEIEKRLSKRKKLFDMKLINDISAIFEDVSKNGDKAVLDATSKFDGVNIESIKLDEKYISKYINEVDSDLNEKCMDALSNIIEVNEKLMPKRKWITAIRLGTKIGEINNPFESVGLWIPARKGVLVSTALMMIGAAKVAGVKRIVVGMPPKEDGLPDPVTVAIAKNAGADEIIVGNGVAIIAAWSIGTESIKKVDGIFGPGPAGISAAMTLANLYGVKTVTGIGPSDSAIISDGYRDPKILAYDLLCEAEHGADSTSILVTVNKDNAYEVAKEVDKIIDESTEKRSEILKTVFGKDGTGCIIVAESIMDAVEIINDFAPEHLMIKVSPGNERLIMDNLLNCGEILIGENTPFSAANYAIGITAVLPTSGFAKNMSGITCKEMLKSTTIGKLDKDALWGIKEIIDKISTFEKMPFHRKAVDVRFENNIIGGN